MLLTLLCFYCLESHPDLLENSAKPVYCNSVCYFGTDQFEFCLSVLMPLPLSSFLSFSLTVMFNFILHDQRKGPIWNIIMWTSLFLGQGVIICLYSQEWYAQRYCPLEEVTLAAFFFMHFGAPVLPPFHVMF